MKTKVKKRVPEIGELVAHAARSDIASIGSVVNKIMGIIRNPNANANELRKVIEVDPPLSAKVLRRANSAYYGVKRNILSIQEAIVLIGFNTVREISMNVKVAKLFEGGSEAGVGYSRKQLWKHSLAVAMACKLLNRREFREQGDDIYAAALLHDIGVMVEDQLAHDHFCDALALLGVSARTLPEAEKAVFNFDHADLGQSLVATWQIPEELARAIGAHHKPLTIDPKLGRSAAAIFVCDFASREAGLAIDPKGSDEEQAYFSRALEQIKVSRDSIEIIIEDVAKEIEEMEKRGELYQ